MVKSHIFKKSFSIIAGCGIAILFAAPYIVFRDEIQNLSVLGYLGLFASCLISNLSILLPTSSTIIIVAAASTLNPWLCILIGGVGTALGEQASYLCGLVSASGFKTKGNANERHVLKWYEKRPFLTVFLFALVPLPVFDIVGIIAGTKKMEWWKYTLAAALGKILKFFIVVLAIYYLFPVLIDKLPGETGEVINEYFDQYFYKNF